MLDTAARLLYYLLVANIASGKLSGSLVSAITGLRLCCERMERQVQEQAALSAAQCAMLSAMPAEGGVQTGELCRAVGLSPSRGGRVIEELAQLGLVERQADPADRRAARLGLTAAGSELKRRLDALIATCEQRIASRLSDEELETVKAGLALLIRVMD